MDILCHQLVSLGSSIKSLCHYRNFSQPSKTLSPSIQALDPCLWHGARWCSAVPPALVTACWGHAPWTPWYTCFIPVLAHMLHPSAGTHLSSFGTALADAQLCLGAGAMPPASVLMFDPSYGTHLSSYGTVLTDAQLCLGISISLISIQIHIFTGPM